MRKKIAAATALFLFCGMAEGYAAGNYEYCMRDASKVGEEAIAECMKAESKRVEQLIYKEYENIAADPLFASWNAGTGMFRGRLKNLYENWYKYRQEYCSLYTYSMEGYLGSTNYNTQRCLLELARKHWDYMKALRQNKVSTPD